MSLMVVARPLKTILPSENHETKVGHLTMDVKEMFQVRKRITDLYFNQKVFVSPCLSKLYISRPHMAVAEDVPEWCYFGTGVIAIIFDTERRNVKLNLFDKHDVHLIWYLKWADDMHILKAKDNFHVINSEEEEYVGILYESEEVANVIEQTIKLLYSSAKVELDENQNRYEKQKLRQCDSLPLEKRTESHEKKNNKRNSLNEFLFKKMVPDSSKIEALPETRGLRSATVHEFSGVFARRAIQGTLPNRPKSDCSDSTRMIKLKRADSFRRNRSQSFDVEPSNGNEKHSRKQNSEESQNKLKENILKVLFKKRRISRTQSLKVEGETFQKEPGETHGDRKEFERNAKLVKPRACTDPMLLKGDWLKFVIDSGIDARDKRERKNWVKTLSSDITPSTDLCATEL